MSKHDQIEEVLNAVERIAEIIRELKEQPNSQHQLDRLADLKLGLKNVKEVAESVEWLYFVEDKTGDN